MSASGTQIGGKVGAIIPTLMGGIARIYDVPGQTENYLGYPFIYTTGSTALADIAYTDVTRTIIADSRVPATYRTYVTRLDLTVTGATAWTTGTSINIQDSVGNIIAGFPLACLSANANYSFPNGESATNVPVTVTGSASTTTVVAVSGTPFVAKATVSLVGAYVRATGGTAANLGLIRQITDHTTGQFTVGTAWPTAPAASDTFEVTSHQAVATTNGTTLTANDSLTTSLMIGKYTSTLTGTGPGFTRQVTANTGSALTVGTMPTAPDTTTTFRITNLPGLNGASAFGTVNGHAVCTSVGYGIQAVLVGTFGAGSNVRLHIEGYFAP